MKCGCYIKQTTPDDSFACIIKCEYCLSLAAENERLAKENAELKEENHELDMRQIAYKVQRDTYFEVIQLEREERAALASPVRETPPDEMANEAKFEGGA